MKPCVSAGGRRSRYAGWDGSGLRRAVAATYGPQINAWLASDTVTDAVKWMVAVCAAITALSLVRLMRPPCPPLPERAT
jgi:hypothetical protein